MPKDLSGSRVAAQRSTEPDLQLTADELCLNSTVWYQTLWQTFALQGHAANQNTAAQAYDTIRGVSLQTA